MRFYPFGSSSLNLVYNPQAAQTASFATYAMSASYATRAVSASYARSGSNGINGTDGVCIYQQGPTGDSGSVGPRGRRGSQSVPQGLI